MTDIRGHVADGFDEIVEVFEQNFELHDEVGAGFSVYLEGEEVVNLTGGVADDDGRPYDEDTLQLIFSSTKGATAVCANLLVERGELDIDAPVVQYWPEFGAHDKGDIPVSWLLCHKSGLITTDRRMSFEEALDWDAVVEALADSHPRWEPGTQHGYHAVTYGWLVGEIVRRVSGKSLGQFFADEVAEPLGLDFWIGLPEDRFDRVSPLIPMSVALGVATSPDGSSDGSPALGLDEMLDPVPRSRQPDRSGAQPRRAEPSDPNTCGTIRGSGPRRCPPPTASPTPGAWPACTPHWSERSTASGCSRRRPWTGRSPPGSRDPTRCSWFRSRSGSGSC